jgi:hypothetical protein
VPLSWNEIKSRASALSLPQEEIPKGIVTSAFLNCQYHGLGDSAKCRGSRLDELPACMVKRVDRDPASKTIVLYNANPAAFPVRRRKPSG